MLDCDGCWVPNPSSKTRLAKPHHTQIETHRKNSPSPPSTLICFARTQPGTPILTHGTSQNCTVQTLPVLFHAVNNSFLSVQTFLFFLRYLLNSHHHHISSFQSSNGLIFLPSANMIVEETVRGKIEAADKPEPCDVRLCDFDGAKFRVFVDAEAPTIVYVSIFVRCYADLYDNGAAEMIANVYEGLFTEEAEDGFDLTLCFDIANLPDDPEVLISKCSELKRNLMAAPFEQAFMAVQQKTTPPPPCSLPFSQDEWMYIFPGDSKVTVFFSVCFEDQNEQAIARVFLQEFAEAKQRVKSGPPVAFNRDAPRELQGMDIALPEGHVGFLSFIIFESHVSTAERLVNSATLLQSFRSYLHYHIKASKSYLATRMRTRVTSLLQTLKEAKPKGPPKAKKNAKGKTFKRR